MKVQGLDSRQHNFPSGGSIINSGDIRPKSDLHLQVRQFLKKTYPLYLILEEVPLPGSSLYFDFVIPNLKLIIEADGQQHKQYNSFFYKTQFDFKQSQKNDRLKEDWALCNNLKLVRLSFNESEEEWLSKL